MNGKARPYGLGLGGSRAAVDSRGLEAACRRDLGEEGNPSRSLNTMCSDPDSRIQEGVHKVKRTGLKSKQHV